MSALKELVKKIKPGDQSANMQEPEYEGQLALDVFQTEKELVVKAPIAGVKLQDLNITVNNEVLTISGARMVTEDITDEDYFTQECYWGPFSRSIILPSTEIISSPALNPPS